MYHVFVGIVAGETLVVIIEGDQHCIGKKMITIVDFGSSKHNNIVISKSLGDDISHVAMAEKGKYPIRIKEDDIS